jgi:5-formyltetrahydrofolate cyclo-ligase
MTKAELRKHYLQKQKALSPAERAQKSELIAKLFFENFDLTGIRYLHCFIALEKFNEIDTLPVFQKLWRDHPGISTLVPRIEPEGYDLSHLRFTADTELVHNAWEIREPTHDERVEPEKIDMVLVPLLAFDAQGHRVGYGKGFYDRFLARCRPDCLKIGLSYFPPVAGIDDAGGHDIALDAFITPDLAYRIKP